MTKRGLFIAVSVLLLASPSFGQWMQDGKEIPDVPSRKSADGFGAMLFVTAEPDAFFEAWKKPDSPGYKPAISTTASARRGAKVVAVVLFIGCHANTDGDCYADVDFKLLRPDGTVYGEHKGAEVWKGKRAPPMGNLQLSVGNLAFKVESDDPLGKYRLEAVVRDNIAKVELSLVQDIEVLPDK